MPVLSEGRGGDNADGGGVHRLLDPEGDRDGRAVGGQEGD